MIGNRGKANAVTTLGLSERTAQTELRDSATARVARTSAAVGNDEMSRRLSAGNATRDQLLAFLCERLKVMRITQMREMAQRDTVNQIEWRHDIAESHADFGKPEPTRWREPARLYAEAADALCRGSVGRGAELMKRAIASEQQQYKELTKLVSVDDLETGAESPVGQVAMGEAAGACDLPPDVALAQVIQNVTAAVGEPATKYRTADPWWLEEEEEEEKPDDGGGV
jgi:hypothetical protein